MTSGGSYYIVPHEQDESPQELVQRISKSEQEQRKRERQKKDEEIQQWKKHNIVGGEGEEEAVVVRGDKEESEAQAVFRCAHFVCSPPGTVKKIIIPRNEFSAGEIEAHQASCEYCIQKREERRKELELSCEGYRQMKYCIHMIRQAQEDIDRAKREIEKEKQRKDLSDWERNWMIRDIRVRELEPSEFQLSKEKAELQKLLEHPNPIIKWGAREEYQKYLNRTKKKNNSFHQS